MIIVGILAGVFILLRMWAAIRHDPPDINADNPYLHPDKWKLLPEEMQEVKMLSEGERQPLGQYDQIWKKVLDQLLSFVGLILLSPVYAVISLAVVLDDPGPVFFRQKRVARNKEFFMLHKFRSMKMSTPHDQPTHMLENPDQYITRVGRFLRKSSLDELPQIWDIFRGKMSVIGPRPALWNQADLIAEREKYGANRVRPGLTGWAQINGRDELEIPVKARLDGDYVRKESFLFDVRCFIGTVFSVARGSGVVEGGTGELNRLGNEAGRPKRVLFLAQHFITLYSFRRELIEQLAGDGCEVWLSLPESEDNKYFTDLGCRIIPTVIDRRGVNPARDLQLILFYRKMIPEIDPDIIFSYTIKPNIYGALALRGKKRKNGKAFHQICNITGTGGTFLENNAVAKICRFLYRHSVRHCDKVFFQNTSDRDLFVRNRMVGDNWELLPGSGVNLEQFHTVPMPEGETVRFIFMGRVMKLKGMDEFLDAAEIIHAEYPETEFYIAGFVEEGEYKERIAACEEHGAVKALGFQKNIVSWIEKCHCTILPSHGGEGVPNVLLESAAMGRICIGSRIAGTEDVIEDGKTGFLFEAGNSEDLVRAIRQVMDMNAEARTEMGLAGRQKVEREFDRNIVVQKYLEEVERA